MPELDGVAATRRIRAELPPNRQPTIVGLSASVLAGDRDAGTRAGMDGYLTKPIRAHDLNATLTALHRRPRGSPPHHPGLPATGHPAVSP